LTAQRHLRVQPIPAQAGHADVRLLQRPRL
jgi:hypothetical protein